MTHMQKLLAAGMLIAGALFAQSTANIVGSIKDSTNAAVPGAHVTAMNVEKPAAADARFRQRRLLLDSAAAGRQYRLEVEKEGFQRYTRSGITLAVGDNATLDVTLAVGSLTESVTVTGAAPLLETQTGTIRGLVDQQRIMDLPLNGRQVTQLMAIQAGVLSSAPGAPARAKATW